MPTDYQTKLREIYQYIFGLYDRKRHPYILSEEEWIKDRIDCVKNAKHKDNVEDLSDDDLDWMIHNAKLDKKSFDLEKENQVKDVSTVEEFCEKYFKPDRYMNKEKDYKDAILLSKKDEIKRHGFCLITHHSSIYARTLTYYPEV